MCCIVVFVKRLLGWERCKSGSCIWLVGDCFMEGAMKRSLVLLLAAVIPAGAVFAQGDSSTPLSPASSQSNQTPASDQPASPQEMNQNNAPNDQLPLFRVKVYSR